MTFNTNDLYSRLVCEDPSDSSADEATVKDTISVALCIDTSGWIPAITNKDALEITKK